MPNIKSAQKKVRKDKTRTAANKKQTGTIAKTMKKMGKMTAKAAKAAVGTTHSLIAKAAKKGIIHKKKAARLQRQVNKLAK